MENTVCHEMRFGREGNAASFQKAGWSEGEEGFTWSLGQVSVLDLPSLVAPDGIVIEMHAFPRVRPEGPLSQIISVSVNGHFVGREKLSVPMILAFFVPPETLTGAAIVVAIEHPGGFRTGPSEPDFAVAFKTFRIIKLLEPWPKETKRFSSFVLRERTSEQIDSLAAEVREHVSLDLNLFLSEFELLSGNCEFGGIQRRCGADPLSLLRFSGASIETSILGLDSEFAGIGTEIRPFLSEDGACEWIIDDLKFNLRYHTQRSETDISIDGILEAQRTKIKFLRRKFMEDLRDDRKIFVCVDPLGLPDVAIFPLFLALNRHGPHPLLWISVTERSEFFGKALEIFPGVIRGFVDRLASDGLTHGSSTNTWISILLNAWSLAKGTSRVSVSPGNGQVFVSIAEAPDHAASIIQSSREEVRSQADAFCAEIGDMLRGQSVPAIPVALRGYLRGRSSGTDPDNHHARELIDRLGIQGGEIREGESFFDKFWGVKREYVEKYCHDQIDDLYDVQLNTAAERRLLLESGPNEIADLSLPASKRFTIGDRRRPSFFCYSSNNAVAYVDPFRYQIITRDNSARWGSASPRALPRSFIAATEHESISQNVVIVQDRFDSQNLSHFVYDCVTRIMLHAEQSECRRNALYVLGSVRTPYHNMIIDALCNVSGITPGQILFPTRGIILDPLGTCSWFTDQFDVLGHPAQMAHPHSIGLLRRLVNALPARPGSVKKLYVSRGDAAARRVVNEAELEARLEKEGFQSIQLAKLPPEEQIGLFEGAEMIVAPHGMGLTHLIMSERIGRVVELFPPHGGTSAYAFVCKAGGIQYSHIVGTEAPDSQGDFVIDVDEVISIISATGGSIAKPQWTKAANLIPGSRDFFGFNPGPGAADLPLTITDCEAPIWGMTVRSHVRGSAPDNFVGGWESIEVVPGCDYIVSAWVFLPLEFSGAEVELTINNLETSSKRPADASQMGCWQRIWSTARSTGLTVRCGIGLLISGAPGTLVASSCWQFERGTTPRGFVPTS